MTFDEYLESLPEDERATLCVYDAWKAGATAMLETLIVHGYIDDGYAEQARCEMEHIAGATE